VTGALTFTTVVELGGKTATGLPVPAGIVESLGAGKRPAVRITLGGYSYRTTIAPMGGRFFVPLSAEHRAAAGVTAGDEVEVTVEVDTAERDVDVPSDLAALLAEDPVAGAFFNGLAYSHRKEWVRWIEDAKKAETRSQRVRVTLDALHQGRRRR
jgi:hypothetical protein